MAVIIFIPKFPPIVNCDRGPSPWQTWSNYNVGFRKSLWKHEIRPTTITPWIPFGKFEFCVRSENCWSQIRSHPDAVISTQRTADNWKPKSPHMINKKEREPFEWCASQKELIVTALSCIKKKKELFTFDEVWIDLDYKNWFDRVLMYNL